MSVKEANKLKKLKALDLSKASTTFWAVKRKGAQPPFEYTVLRVNTPQALLFDAFYQGFGSAVPQLPALLPEVWLHWDPRTVRERGRDALLRFRMDFLLLMPQGIRVVVEVDGRHHYADADGLADVQRYARMAMADRDLKLAGYEVFRFGATELQQTTAKADVKRFFDALFKRYGVVA